MLSSQKLDAHNVATLATLYATFCREAETRYQWNVEPVPFEVFKGAVAENLLEGIILVDSDLERPIGLMIYRREPYGTVEINVLHLDKDYPNVKTALDVAFKALYPELKRHDGWDVVGFALMGEQARYIRYLPWYGFKPMGQTIQKFNFVDTIGPQILGQLQLPPLPEDMRMEPWSPERFEPVAQALADSFAKSSDALWDPRFRSLEGARRALTAVAEGAMGRLVPDCSQLLIRKTPDGEQVLGFCFLLQTGEMSANIPLIGVVPGVKGQKLGLQLMKAMMIAVMKGMMAENFLITEIDATVDTDNWPAVRLYRRTGFREQHNYPHVYLPRESLTQFAFGRWC